jgi:uncharacterized delta-60 repeat protein
MMQNMAKPALPQSNFGFRSLKLAMLFWIFNLLHPSLADAQGPVLIKEVISREHALFTGADADFGQALSREIALFVGADPDAKQVVSREVSLLLSDTTPPPAIPTVILTLSPRRDTVTLDWSAYNQWSVRDVASYAIFYSPLGFTSTVGMTPFRIVTGENFTTTFTGMPEYGDFFFAVVPIDGLGNQITTITPTSNYALTKEIISREMALFNGYEGAPQFKQLVSREVSLLLSDTTPPPPVTNLSFTHTPTGNDITLSWDGYNQWATRDVAAYQIFRSSTPFTTVTGMTPYATVTGENFTKRFPTEPANVDSFWAVVAVDGQGNRQPLVSYKGVYVISPQAISREVALFNGHEPATPQLHEIVSREVSLVVASPAIPDPVTGLTTGFEVTTANTQYAAIDVNWTSYNEAAQRDIKRYRIYVGTSFFDTVAGLTPFKTVADGTQRHVIYGTGTNGQVISPEQIYYVAVVAEDVTGQFNPVVYAESVKASVGALGDVSNVVATPAPSTISYAWDLGGVGTNLQNFVKGFRIYFDGPNRPNTIPYPLFLDVPAARTWTATSLAFGTTYTMRLTTVDVLGQESPGVTVVATTLTVPPGDVELPWNPGANSDVWTTMTQTADRMIAMGDFTTIGGVSRNRIARLDLSGTADATFNPNANGTVWNAAMQPDGRMVVCGAFTTIGGTTRNRVARLNATGTLDAAFLPTANGIVRSVAVQMDGKILLGGEFTQVNGVTRNRLARLHADGTLDTAFDPNVNNVVRPVVVQPDGKILIGGTFTSIGATTRNRMARLNADGTLDAAFNPNADNQVNAIELRPDGRILVGGAFTTLGGVTRNRLARLSSVGVVDAAYNPDANGSVWSFASQTDGRTLVAGAFTTVGTVIRNRLARLLDDGTLDSTFNPNANSTVNGVMLQPDGKIIVSGASTMTTIGGQPRSRIARLYNNPAPNTLGISNISQLTWQRGGTSAEARVSDLQPGGRGVGRWEGACCAAQGEETANERNRSEELGCGELEHSYF